MEDIYHENFILFFWFNGEKKSVKMMNYGGNMINKTLIPWTH